VWRKLRSILDRHVFNSVERKLVAASLLAVLIPLLGTAFYGNWFTSRVLREQAIDSVRLDLEQRSVQIETYLEGVRNNVLYLADVPELHALLRARQSQDRRRIAETRHALNEQFAAFARTHPVYYQIRYIAEDGQEMVRINARGGTVEVVPPGQLQQKGHRYYFREAIRLAPGQIYVSPVDLNREFGELEIPYTPVIRYATPVFYDNGQRAGIVIINLYAEEFLRYISTGRREGILALVDQDGYYMVHPDMTRVWGHPWDLGTGYRLHMDFPREWPHILSPMPGIVEDASYIIIHRPIFPNRPDTTRYWIVLQAIPKDVIFASVRTFRVTAVGILLVAVLAGVTMAAFMGRNITAPVLVLTERARRFGQGEPYVPVRVTSQDEIGELTRAFNDMARRLERNMERLARMTQLGQRIAAQLDHEAVLDTLLDAVDELFLAEYRVVRLTEHGDEVVKTRGDVAWEVFSQLEVVRDVRTQVRATRSWRAARIPLQDGRNVYMCAAFLECRTHGVGEIELYGYDPALASAAAGNLLATLAVQASIALENAHLYNTLADHKAQLQSLLEQLITAQEEERRIVAYDIHDGLVQRLVGARLQLMNFLGMHTPICPEAQEALDKAAAHLTAAIVEARRVIEGLRPGLLDDLGLVPALEYYAHELGTEAGWQVHMDVPTAFPRLPATVEVTAFRIVQEALNNAHKYAQAHNIWIQVRLDNGILQITVEDDGRGFDPDSLNEGGHVFGILGMQERAHLLGGTCEIRSRPGKGTSVYIHLPIPHTENSDVVAKE